MAYVPLRLNNNRLWRRKFDIFVGQHPEQDTLKLSKRWIVEEDDHLKVGRRNTETMNHYTAIYRHTT